MKELKIEDILDHACKSVSLAPLEWLTILESIQRGVMNYEEVTGKTATGLRELWGKVRTQLQKGAA